MDESNLMLANPMVQGFKILPNQDGEWKGPTICMLIDGEWVNVPVEPVWGQCDE